MVHRALYGSVERFFGILIEHYAGAFPVWLAPVQAVVMPITDRQLEYAKTVHAKLEAAGFRSHLDDRKEKVNLKIRDAQMQKVPYMLVCGDREAEAGTVSVRHRKHADMGVKAGRGVHRGSAGAGGFEGRQRVVGRPVLPAALLIIQ